MLEGLSYKAGEIGMARLSREQQLRRADLVLEAYRRLRTRQAICEAVTPFYIWRADTGQVLARGVLGYDAAKDKANELRQKLGLKWDQVKFKSEKKTSSYSSGAYGRHKASTFAGGAPKGGRMDYSKNYNPSKRGKFRGYYDKDGNFHDLD